jgi:NTP pyrophosphatase (non-canonical NTP hydrolase)
MNPTEYMRQALKLESNNFAAIRSRLENDNLLRGLHAAIGLATETGELVDAYKKYMFYGKQIDNVNIVEELGDLMWYLAIACDSVGVTIEEVMALNIKKLRGRYPTCFTEHDAQHRDLDAERKILEGGDA